MRPLSQTLARLAAMRSSPLGGASPAASRLQQLTNFGSNPGTLDAWTYAPDQLAENAPLVVVLHGCTQNAAAYDCGAGWSQIADEFGFALLFPEQRAINNANRCFNWFEPQDCRREGGEAHSIAQMIETMVRTERLDRSRIFVTGLSAGGAMSAVLLATYPEVFAGGAIVAGLPFGVAANVQQALQCMRGQGTRDPHALAARVRAASRHAGPWPAVSIWHGTADHVVVPSNADDILAQWQVIHDVPGVPYLTDMVDGHAHRTWRDAQGRTVIEDYRIAGMGHGTPLSTVGPQPTGTSGPHMLEAGISSTRCIAAFWGLSRAPARRMENACEPSAASTSAPSRRVVPPEKTSAAAETSAPAAAPHSSHQPASNRVGRIIEDALRATGLMH